jgi:hypothetical protein
MKVLAVCVLLVGVALVCQAKPKPKSRGSAFGSGGSSSSEETVGVTGADILAEVQALGTVLATMQTDFTNLADACAPEPTPVVAAPDCSDPSYTALPSGVRLIGPYGRVYIPVYCDQDTDGGGWTVFQRRQDGSQDFFLNWVDYQNGFGNIEGEFWLGLDILHTVTSSGSWNLRVDMEQFDSTTAYAQYSAFSVGDEASNYQLSIGSYTGDAGDDLTYHNNMPFSTKDNDNDNWPGNCAQSFTGAFWYNRCHDVNINGQYYASGVTPEQNKGLVWESFTTKDGSLKFSEMKMRPTGYTPA